jgi:hypothetical protein
VHQAFKQPFDIVWDQRHGHGETYSAMPSFEINAKELWIGVLRKAGIIIETREDGPRWVDIDVLFAFLQTVRGALWSGSRLEGPSEDKP